MQALGRQLVFTALESQGIGSLERDDSKLTRGSWKVLENPRVSSPCSLSSLTEYLMVNLSNMGISNSSLPEEEIFAIMRFDALGAHWKKRVDVLAC
ncbi:hypothetical protein U1Q18_020662 [Sarracenia purpurea var. burkii]